MEGGKEYFAKRVLIGEAVAFLAVIALIWLDEIIDIPYLILGGAVTPVNWRESLFETVIVGVLGLVIVFYTRKIFARMKYLEGFLPICASCKKIRDDAGTWQEMECYIGNKSAAQFSHGICPSCARKLYPELYPPEERTDLV